MYQIKSCPNCKHEIHLMDSLWNQCDNCHRWYNLALQEVKSPDAWRSMAHEDFNEDEDLEVFDDREDFNSKGDYTNEY